MENISSRITTMTGKSAETALCLHGNAFGRGMSVAESVFPVTGRDEFLAGVTTPYSSLLGK